MTDARDHVEHVRKYVGCADCRLQAQVEAAETKLAGIAAAAALAVKNEQWRIAAAEKRGEVAGLRKALDVVQSDGNMTYTEIEALIAKAEKENT